VKPFPLNKTFKPPTPLSDRLKDAIWLMHDTDRVNHTPRHIAAEVGLSIPRVEAILKLKYLEKDWKKVSRSCPGHPPSTLHIRDEHKNRLVFKTPDG
jgi:hypothetical protein